jgi:hypothetical protein
LKQIRPEKKSTFSLTTPRVAKLAAGVEQFRNVIDGPPSMRNVVSDLSMALEDLPDKVSFC